MAPHVVLGTPKAARTRPDWENYNHWGAIHGLAEEGRTLWLATMGGVLRWSLEDDSYDLYTVWDGLGDNYVCCVALGRDGAKWFGTKGGGLSRFDGSWRTWTVRDGLPSDYVGALAVAADGAVWAGTESGLARLDAAGEVDRRVAGLEKRHVACLDVEASGRVWAGTLGRGLARVDGRDCRLFTEAEGLPDGHVRGVRVDSAGRVWAGTRRGIASYDGRAWSTAREGEAVSCVAEDRRGRLWFGTDGGLVEDAKGNKWFGGVGAGLLRLENGAWTRHELGRGPGANVLSLFAGEALWAGTGEGFYAFDAADPARYQPRSETLPYNGVISVHVDRRGRRWFGTSQGGLCRWDGRAWKTFGEADGSLHDNVQALAEDSRGRLWCGTGKGVFCVDGEAVREFAARDGLPADYVSAAVVDREDRVWVGTRGGGVGCFDGTAWRQGGLEGAVVRAAAADAEGRLWFGAVGRGACRFDGRSWERVATARGLLSDNVYALAIDREGNVWIGTDLGLARWDGSRLANIVARPKALLSILKKLVLSRNWKGLLSALFKARWRVERELAGDYVRALAVDRAGILWVGTLGGLSRFDGKAWRKFTQRDGLCHYNIRGLAADPDGTLWVATMGGVSRLLKTDE